MTAYTDSSRSTGRGRARGAPLLALWLALGTVGCDNLVQVENPNNVRGEDLENPTAAGSIANGALYSVSAGYTAMLAPYSTVTDEVTWVGSRDSWGELMEGFPGSAFNEFNDGAFPYIAEGRWMADEAVKLLEGFDASGDLAAFAERTDLARSYLYAAMAYVFIGDWLDDFALSDRREAAPPIGEAGMSVMYTTAIGYLDKGLVIAQAEGDSDLELDILAMRARAKHALAVWGLVGTRPISTANNGMVSDAGAVADAQAALAMDGSDWRFQFLYSAGTVDVESLADGGIQWQVSSRLELSLGPNFFVFNADGKRVDAPALNDPIAGTADPVLQDFLDAFPTGDSYSPLTVLSAREMHLIIAESEFATSGDNTAFRTAINDVRDFDGLPDYTGQPGVSALDLLRHMRSVNLYLQGRRLSDLYRWGLTSPQWQANSTAVTDPGTFLPITRIEIESNCHINPDFACPTGG